MNTHTFKFSFTGRQSGAIGITYRISDSYKASNIHEALSYLYEDYDHIQGLKCANHEIPKNIEWVKVRSHRERKRGADNATYLYNN